MPLFLSVFFWAFPLLFFMFLFKDVACLFCFFSDSLGNLLYFPYSAFAVGAIMTFDPRFNLCNTNLFHFLTNQKRARIRMLLLNYHFWLRDEIIIFYKVVNDFLCWMEICWWKEHNQTLRTYDLEPKISPKKNIQRKTISNSILIVYERYWRYAYCKVYIKASGRTAQQNQKTHN